MVTNQLTPLGWVERSVTGTEFEVSQRLNRLADLGVLMDATPIMPIRNRPGVWFSLVRVYTLDIAPRQLPARTRYSRRRRITIGISVAVGILLILAGLGWWAYVSLAPALANAGGTLVGLLILAALVWLLLGQTGHCPGLHCPGCRCGGHR